MTLKEIAIQAVIDAGSKEIALRSISYGKAKFITDSMFKHISEEECNKNIELLEQVREEILNL